MGCGSSRTKLDTLHTPLDSRMEHTGVDSIDSTFSNASSVMEKLENIRVAVVDNRDSLVVKTGAIAYLKPDFNACILSFLWLVSTYTKGELKNTKINLKDGVPFFDIELATSKKVSKAYETLSNYIKGLVAIKDDSEGIFDEMTKLSETIAGDSGKYVDECKEQFKDDFKKMY